MCANSAELHRTQPSLRNPMYVGFYQYFLERHYSSPREIIEYTGRCVHHLFLVVVLYEGRAEAEEFGGSYRQYCRNVSRWIPWRMKTYKG